MSKNKKIITKNELQQILKSVDGNSEIAVYILGYILKNTTRIKTFLKKHELSSSFFYPLANIFALVNSPEYDRKEMQKLKDLNLQSLCIDQSKTLLGLWKDKELKKIFEIDIQLVEKLLLRNMEILKLPFPKRYNDKTILKKKLKKVFFMFEKKGLGQTKQINIIMDLFVQEEFEDYKSGSSKYRFERIRKTYQEPALNEYKMQLYRDGK